MEKPRFVKSRRYIDKKGRKFGKGVWFDDNGKIIKPGQGIYDKNKGTVTQYNTDGTVTTYSREGWINKKSSDHEMRVLQNDKKYAIPYIPEKRMTITIDKNSPTSRNRGAVLSENMLDSIAVNAKKAGLPFKKAIGLASVESTFGQGERGIGQSPLPWLRHLDLPSNPYHNNALAITYPNEYSPTALISNWEQDREFPFAPYIYDSSGYLRSTPRPESYFAQDFGPSVRKTNRFQFKEQSPLEHGFRFFKENPTKYNPGNPAYPAEVDAAGEELTVYSPEIRNYMQKNNIKSDGGAMSSHKSWDDLSMQEKYELMQVAINNGITNLRDIKSKYNEFASGGNIYKGGSYLDIAKQHIRKNEGFRAKPYADGPAGTGWRSVGYGFNDSGFRSKYPNGISRHYENGISRQQAEEELDWYIQRADAHLRKIYGKKWDSFTDNQKAAIHDSYYQKPASVDGKSMFYNAVMSGNPNVASYLGVKGFGDRNNDRRSLFQSLTTPSDISSYVTSMDFYSDYPSPFLKGQYEGIDFEPLNAAAVADTDTFIHKYQHPEIVIEPEQPLVEAANQYSEAALKAEERQNNLRNFAMVTNLLNGSSDNNPYIGVINMLADPYSALTDNIPMVLG